MRQQPIADRLAGLGFRQVGGVIEYAALTGLPGALPAGFVVPQGEVASDNTLATGGIDQAVRWSFAVVAILPAAARQPGALDELLETLTRAVKDALVGWSHPDASGPCTFVGAELVGAGSNALSWAVRFRCPYRLRKV